MKKLIIFITIICLFLIISLIPKKNIQTDNIITSIPNTGFDNYYLEQIKTSLNTTAGLFDNFIAFTPDPTGLSTCDSSDTLYCEMYFKAKDEITFPATDTVMPSTIEIVSLLNLILFPLAVILISIEGYTVLLTEKMDLWKDLIKRIVVAIIMIILTPHILSISILAINQLSFKLLGNMSLTGFISGFITALESSTNPDPFLEMFKDLLEFTSFGSLNPLSYIYALPILLPLGLIFLLLLYIAIQFIIRFLSLYLLASVYPLAIIFSLHTKTASISSNFWKQWVTFLIQQPVFLTGFLVVSKVLESLFTRGISLEVLIIFVGLLIFLATINLFTARIWGDIYVAASQNIVSAFSASALKHTLIDKPLDITSRIIGGGASKLLGSKDEVISLPEIKANESEDTKKSDPMKQERQGSLLKKELDTKGYQVSDLNDGRLAVTGRFYGNEGNDDPVAKLYTNKDDAIKDGLVLSNLKPYDLKDLQIQDASNKKMLLAYNRGVIDHAGENGGHAKGSGLSYKSNDDKVARSMDLAKDINVINGVQAIGIKSDGVKGDKSIDGDNLIKIHVYKEVLDNYNANDKSV